MKFTNIFIETKIEAVKGLFRAIKWAWNEHRWSMVILATLWTMFCIIGGILFAPVDFILQAIIWNASPWQRRAIVEMKEIAEDFATDW